MQMNQLDQFITELGDDDMDNFIDIMIDDNPYRDYVGYCNVGAISEDAITFITRNDINV